jgi:hypothetical protein
MDKTLEEQLLEQGFQAIGPFAKSDLGNEIRRLFILDQKITYVQIIQGQLCRSDMVDYPKLYMIYHK